MIKNFHNDFNLIATKVDNFITPKTITKLPYTVIYNFTFISLIAPYLLNDLRLINITSTPSTPKKSTALLKQSYLIFTWFYYLANSVAKGAGNTNMIKFAFLPIKRKSYTLTKAPMAHKTNSKEQFVFKFFKFKACIQTRFTIDGSLSSVNASVWALLQTKSIFPTFETNLLLLKHYRVFLLMNDGTFFSYYKFIKNSKKLLK